jgi:hypothetical protein
MVFKAQEEAGNHFNIAIANSREGCEVPLEIVI